MELPIPRADPGKLQRWFEAGEWTEVESYLIARHPEHSALISDWIAGSKQRSEGGSPKPVHLAAVG
ncbi:hypothetical protein D5041_17040 [Verminephrobacter aporrectodeae subsp. tuberculatae]|nr:hypothetical protein [Verminephrobacter aporrectodeae]MCW5221392.1 hypothetical protein [Verminephrobacter aporrectodeae subsp. tuberculatae]MCW5290683.1 hypothetical protein [Verminephrobacter aporrectodeae subsp. tuberculatae]